MTYPELSLRRISGVTLTGRDWSQDLARLQNMNVSMTGLMKRMFGVSKDSEDICDVNDSTTRTVTSTSWTNVALYVFHPRFSHIKSYTYYVIAGICGYVSTSGQRMYVRLRDYRTGVTSDVIEISSTSPLWVYPSYTTTGALNEWYGVLLDAYVTGGTGYITQVWIYVHEAPNVLAIKSSGPGFRLTPIRATENDNLRVAFQEVGGVPITGRNWSLDFEKLQNLDVALTTLARLQRWGRDVTPFWVHGGEITAPSAGTALVSRTVTSGRQGFIYGFYIMASEPNDFRVNWTSGGTARSIRIPFTSAGALHFADFVALNEGLPADGGTTITITNVNAGSSGSTYQARLLVAEL